MTCGYKDFQSKMKAQENKPINCINGMGMDLGKDVKDIKKFYFKALF